MDSDDEKEAFEVTDYELDNEFNPNRPQRRQTKNQSIYGVWARDSDDEEEQRMGLGGGSRRGGFDPLGDMGFISHGFKGDKDDEEGNDTANDPGPSTSKSAMTTAEKRHAKLMKADKNFASWQKHTKGFGEKLLLQMGYIPGKGLGKANQGIVRPVEATKHKGKGAIGHGTPLSRVIVSDDEADEEEIAKKLGQPVQKKSGSKWKKNDNKNQKKYVYKTVDEVKKGTVVSKKPKTLPNKHISNVKVIDMTGPEQRVLSGYEEIARGHDKPEDTFESIEAGKKAFEMPELMHNLDLLVEMAEQRIIKHDRQLHHEDDMIVNLQHEREKTGKVLEQEEAVIKRLSTVLEVVESLAERSQPGHENPATLNDFEETLRQLREEMTEEWKAFQLVDLTVALVFPLIRREIQNWDPISDSKKHVELFQTWKDIIDAPDCLMTTADCPSITAYERLVWEELMPFVRRSMAAWNVHDCDPPIEFLENWLPLVPRWILNNILDQLILPKLQRAVEQWNPLTDIVPIHSWLHPWLPLLGEKLAPLYIPIRQKFGSALRDWHPSDSSAKTILLPWKQVFSKGTMDVFVMRHISPKLAMCLQQFVINPYQQHLEPFEWVMAWEDFMPRPTFVKLFETNFFPKWLQVLCSWLNNNPNYQEVGRWYTGWKKMFPDYMHSEPAVKSYFNQALEVMNRAVSGSGPIQTPLITPSTAPPPPPPMGAPPLPTQSSSAWASEVQMARSATTSIPTTFKDLVERKAAENGILFVPTQRRHEGKTIYSFGHLAMFIDRGVPFVQQGAKWTPMSIYEMIKQVQGL
ncbi:tuftelin-interacting protein 11-like [Diadema antillarum]|uniref:tuftelin-interacting protein 11-like n=1 Tax=Diadema antillarum TaxID=105358 RepID=UPI003A8B17FE